MARRMLIDLSPLGVPWCYLGYLVSPYEQNLHSIPTPLVLNAQSSMYFLLSLIQLHNYVDFITLLHKYSSIRTTFMSVIIHISRSRVVYIVKQCIES